MKAAQINKFGDSSVVEIKEIGKPPVAEGQVQIEVHASSINPVDIAIRSGMLQQMMPINFPATLGGDVAGEVSEVGDGVKDFAVGDKVYGQANVFMGNSGAFAEFAVTDAGQLAKIPGNLDFKQAASLPLVGVSALQALTDHLGVTSGQKILITGGGGGIGSIAIQIAKHLGANVTTTASGEGAMLAKQLGADTVVDYKQQKLSDLSADFDAVFDTVGDAVFNDTLRLIKSGGKAVSMIAQADQNLVKEQNITATMQITQVNTEKLSKLAQLVENGIVKPQVSKVFSLDEIVGAFQAKESNTVPGKIVIAIVKE